MVPYGCFYELGVLFLGVLIEIAPLIGVYIMAPDLLETPRLSVKSYSIQDTVQHTTHGTK